MIQRNPMQELIDNINAGIEAGLARAGKTLQPPKTRAAYRVCLAVAKRADKMTFVELQTLIDAEIDRDDALEELGDSCCPACGWIGNAEDCDAPLLRRGGPFSGPLDGATPDEHDDPKCPRCETYVEECA